MRKIYPDSKVEIQGLSAKFYDTLMNFMTFGGYSWFIKKAIHSMNIISNDVILDFGAGTGRNALLMNEFLSENGEILGLEISNLMIDQFKNKTRKFKNLNVINQRIDQPFELEKKYDKVFISFVLHGFPLDVQKQIIQNAFNALKKDGKFIILDFNEFLIDKTPLYFRIPFKIIECKYAFEYVERDWKHILSEFGFSKFSETLFLKKHIRLLKAIK
ncbi:MAG: class I SAM-dependent methyltransferase [Candidatus Tenebribacter davisii]|jgi:demethylmenaquinone methyltransferase/2-methoxy-6-polyprenyl-1,4-benzoquinol methylase|nr:class I SAM-dependent methyltransferase [Candidatus Tenebribacter davisii]